MYFLVYVSSAANKLSEEDLLLILEKSRSNNAGLSVTGLLVYIDGNIIQILEGDKERVLGLYNRIATDPRHRGMIKLIDGPLKERNFEDWSMQFKSLSYDEAAKVAGYKNLSRNDLVTASTIGVHPALKVISTFCKTNLY